jgi:outer membrane protein
MSSSFLLQRASVARKALGDLARARATVVLIRGTLFTLAIGAHPAHGLDLKESYDAALARDPTLASAVAAHTGGIEVLEQAKAKLGTTVGATATAAALQTHLEGFPPANGSTTQGAITLDQPLYHPADSVVVNQAQAQVSKLDAQLTGAQQDLVLRVAQAYFNTLLAQDLLEATHREQESIAKQLAQAHRSYEVGTVPITDVSDAKARYDLTTATELQTRSDMEIARHALEQLTGLQAESLAGVALGVALHPPEPDDMQYWVNAAVTRSPIVLQAIATADSQQKEIDHTRAARYPTVDLFASLTKENYSQSGLDAVGTAGRTAEIGVLISIPIWDGGARNSAIRQAVAGADQAHDDLQVSKDVVAQAARQYYTGVMSALAQARALQQAVESGKVSLEGSIRGQQVGTRTAVDVLNARQLLYQSQRQLAAARYAAIVDLLQLKAIAGELTPHDLEGLTSAANSSALSPE